MFKNKKVKKVVHQSRIFKEWLDSMIIHLYFVYLMFIVYFLFIMISLSETIQNYSLSSGFISRFEEKQYMKQRKSVLSLDEMKSRLNDFVSKLQNTLLQSSLSEKIGSLSHDSEFMEYKSQTSQIQYFYSHWSLRMQQIAFIFGITKVAIQKHIRVDLEKDYHYKTKLKLKHLIIVS